MPAASKYSVDDDFTFSEKDEFNTPDPPDLNGFTLRELSIMDTSMFQLDIAGEGFTKSSLYTAIRNLDPSGVLEAIRKGDDVHSCDPDFNSTYLHLLANVATSQNEEKLVPIVYQLSNAGIDVDAVDYEGQTALEIALRGELQMMVAALIRVGADLRLKDYKGILKDMGSPFQLELTDTLEKYEPGLWQAVADNNCGMVQILVYSWCRVNVQKKGQTLMDLAKQSRASDSLISVLDDYQVTMEFVHATLAGDEKRMLEFLMDSKPCDPYIMDISFQETLSAPLSPRSLRDTAIAMGHQHLLNLIPEDNLNLDQDIKGYFGGSTLESILKGDRRQSLGKTNKVTNKVTANGPKSYKGGPMKAFSPHPALPGTKPPIAAKPDVIAHNSLSDAKALKLKLDLLNSASNSLDQSYEQSRFTGSVALRSKGKSRKMIRDAYSYTDDWTPMEDEPNIERSGSLDSAELKSIEHIATPRGQPSSNFEASPGLDYSKNWSRSSLKASFSKSKARSKDIRSKMCVIS